MHGASMSDISAGESVKWKRVYFDAGIIHYGTLLAIEVGAEQPCAIVRPKSGAPDQRVPCDLLLRARDSGEPQADEWDLLMVKDFGYLRKMPRRMPTTWIQYQIV